MQKRAAYRFIFGMIVISAIVSSAASQSPAKPAAVPRSPDRTVPSVGADLAAVAETRTYLNRLEKLGFAGVVLVARGEAPLVAEGYGLADRELGLRWSPAVASNLGSITKQFTGAAILALEEAKKLSVTDPITRYFDGVPADKAAITLHQLLTHSSGLADPPDIGDYDAVPLPEFVRRVFAEPLLFQPGRGYEYANANFSLLGAVVEKLSGVSYERFLRERFFLPAGMYETGYQLPLWGVGRTAQGYIDGTRWGTVLERSMAADGPHWALRANGGIQSTVYDMLRWARALLAGRVLAPESMKKLWAPHVSEGGDTFYAYGWSIAKAPDGTKIVSHNGGNGIFYADLAIVPAADLVIVLMTNVIAENRSANSLLEQIGMRFLAGRPLPAIPEVVDMSAAALAPFAGTYTLPAGAGAYRVTSDGKALFIEADGRKAFALLNSVGEAEPGRLDKLTALTGRIVAGNLKGDFKLLAKAYGGEVTVDRLKSNWAEGMAAMAAEQGRLLRTEVLGSARTAERDETVVRFHCEKGAVDWTYVWDIQKQGRLRGRSERGLAVRLRLYPSGERKFFTWDGGIRPPKMVHIEAGADGKLALKLGEAKDLAMK
jgi:CubicO group peptidase (beta-lactamase class C family)